jgi:hypothetical protein
MQVAANEVETSLRTSIRLSLSSANSSADASYVERNEEGDRRASLFKIDSASSIVVNSDADNVTFAEVMNSGEDIEDEVEVGGTRLSVNSVQSEK